MSFYPKINLAVTVTSSPADTIAAIATPAGRAAIAVIRVSGSEAGPLVAGQLRRFGRSEWPTLRPLVREFLNAEGCSLDQVVATFFRSPASYTGEDVVEISCHGSPVISHQILETLLKKGARVAQPGEFTLRAFLNGKMDLTQAEAVRDLIESQTTFQAGIAAEQLQGRLSQALESVKEMVVKALCNMETTLEFVEDEVTPAGRPDLIQALEQADSQLAVLNAGFDLGRLVQQGVLVAITGKPNSGKSSIFNKLVEYDRVIVTNEPGTTRDAVTEAIDVGGIPARLVDTAGIREARGRVEHLGVQKSLQYLRECDAALFVVDRATDFAGEDSRIWRLIREGPYVLVLNKEDLPAVAQVPREVMEGSATVVTVSALEGTHFGELKQALRGAVAPDHSLEKEGLLVTNLRHQRCIERSRHHLREGISALRSGLSEEFPLYDCRKALAAVEQITGETTAEEILGQIFSTFCIGK